MAGRRKSVGPVNYHELPRRKLQSLCKKYGFPANKTNVAMADALTALLNAPERLASGIDSPAVSSRSYFSSSVDESPMTSPGVDSLPTISESRPEVFEGLRITRLPEIMEVESSPPEEVTDKSEEVCSGCGSDEMQTSKVTDMMTDDTAPAVSIHPDSNSKEKEVSDTTPRSGRELKQIGRSDTTEAIPDDFTAPAGPSSDEERKDMEYFETSETMPDETSETEGLGNVNEAVNMHCEERPTATFGNQHVGESEPTPDGTMEASVSISLVMTETQIPVPEEMTEASERMLDEVTEAVAVSVSPELWSENPTPDEAMMGGPSEDLPEGVPRDSTAEMMTDEAETTSSSEHVTNAITLLVPRYGTGEAGDSTPIPLSVMPHSSVSDHSVSNKEVGRLAVDLNNGGFPRADMFETGGETKINSHNGEGVSSRGGSEGMDIQDTEFSRTTWAQDAFGPFKCLNPAALSPKVRRSLGIDIPRASVSRLASSPLPKCRASFEKQNECEFAVDDSAISLVVSPAVLAPPKATDIVRALDIQESKTGVFNEEKSTIQERAVCLPNEETSETTQQISADDENGERSESCSSVPGYVKEIVNLLENKSGEESKESAGASRKDSYKQSALVRSSRLAADIERASKLGQVKRAAVLAGKRSLWPPTNSASPMEEEELHIAEDRVLQNTSSDSPTIDDRTGEHDITSPGSPPRDRNADMTGDTDSDQVSPPLAEEPCVQITCEAALADTRISPQHDQVNGGDNSLDSIGPPTQVDELIECVMLRSYSSPTERPGIVDTPTSPQVDEMNAGDNHPGLSVLPPAQVDELIEDVMLENDSSPTERSEMVDTPTSPQLDEMNAGDDHSGLLVLPPTQVDELIEGGVLENGTSPMERTETMLEVSGIPEEDEKTSTDDVVEDDGLTPLSDKTTGAVLPDIKYVEIPRPVETNVECGPISELSWIRKATNLPTAKSQKLSERIKRPVSANLRKFELMERAALNAAKKHRTPKKANQAKSEAPGALVTNVPYASASLEENHAPTTDTVDFEMKELTPEPASRSLNITPDKLTAPLSIRDCNKELGVLIVESCPVTPKSPAISLDEILRENTLSTDKENLRGKENDRLRRHQEEYKTPLTGRSKEKAIRAAEMNAASLREKILKQRRGIEEEELPQNDSGSALKQSLLGRLL